MLPCYPFTENEVFLDLPAMVKVLSALNSHAPLTASLNSTSTLDYALYVILLNSVVYVDYVKGINHDKELLRGLVQAPRQAQTNDSPLRPPIRLYVRLAILQPSPAAQDLQGARQWNQEALLQHAS
jgi:hypothetical protein